MKKMKNLTLWVIGATMLSLGLYACSNDNEATVTNNNTTQQNTIASSQVLTNFKVKYQNLNYEIINENIFHIIDSSNGVHPVQVKSNGNLRLDKISETEAILFEETAQKEYARLKIIEIKEDLVYMDVVLHNGKVFNNIEMPKTTLGWGVLGPILVELIGQIIDYIGGGDTALPEMVIYDMKDCYKNHMIAMQNCVGGSVSLIADQSTGQCSIGNCVR